MNYWHMQLHPDKQDWDKEIDLLNKLSLIGLGKSKSELAYDNFYKMKNKDIVLIKNGKKVIALVEVVGDIEDIDHNKDIEKSLDWFRLRRKVKVLAIVEKNNSEFPQPRGTLSIAKNKDTVSYKYIDNWYKELVNTTRHDISKYINDDLLLLAKKKSISIVENRIQYKDIEKLFSLTTNSVNNIKIDIENVKNVKILTFDFKLEKGLYTIVGENGIGKSSLLISLGRLVNGNTLRYEFKGDIFDDSVIQYTFNNILSVKVSGKAIEDQGYNRWQQINRKFVGNIQINEFPKIDGFFESSIISGTRFEQLNIKKSVLNFVDKFNKKSKPLEDIEPDTDFIKINLDEIINTKKSNKYDSLFTMKSNKWNEIEVCFLKNNGHLISEFSFSTGEYFILSILKLIKKHNNKNTKSLIIIDEIDISLHPKAQQRLVKKLKEFTKEYNLTILIATHSLPIIDATEGKNLFYTENNGGNLIFQNNKKAGLISSYLYEKVIFDRVILVEDQLAREFIEKIIEQDVQDAYNSLYTIIPIGGWEKVLEIYDININENFIGKKVLAILDGDVKEMEKYLKENYSSINHDFLPIQNIEQYITEVCIKEDSFQNLIKTKYLKTKNFNELNIKLGTEYYFDFRNKFKEYVHPTENKDKLLNNFSKFLDELENYKDNVGELIQSNLKGDKKTVYNKLKLEIINKSSLKEDDSSVLDTFFIEEIIKDLKQKDDLEMKKFIKRIDSFIN